MLSSPRKSCLSSSWRYRNIYEPYIMHQHTISSPQDTTASGRQLDQVEPHVPDEATTRSHGEFISSHSSMNPVLHPDLDPVLAPTPPPASDACSEMLRRSASSKRTDFTVKHPPLSLLGRVWGSRQTWRIPATILGFYFICKNTK